MNRRDFCYSLIALPATASATSMLRWEGEAPRVASAVWDQSKKIRFVLQDLLEHPFYWWPRTLLGYPVEFHEHVDLNRLMLTRTDTGEQIPIQFSDVITDHTGPRNATLHFFAELPSGGHREFVLTASDVPMAHHPQVIETHEAGSIVLDSGLMKIRIPASQTVLHHAAGPVMQVSRGGKWMGNSTLAMDGKRVLRIATTRVEHGPLFVAYEIAYEIEGGSHYKARVQCNAGMDFVRLQEDMEGLHPGVTGTFISNWTGFAVTHRQAPNHPLPFLQGHKDYDSYPWERIDKPFFYVLDTDVLPKGQLPLNLGIYQTWTAVHTATSANFWDEHTKDALGLFIDRPEEWQDHAYASHTEAEFSQVRYHYEDGAFRWEWPLHRGSRSTCITCYDHAKDKQAVHDLDRQAEATHLDGFTYKGVRAPVSYAMWLQNRYNTLDLNRVKDWVLEYPDHGKRPPVIFSTGTFTTADDLERRIMTSDYIGSLPLIGTRENGGLGKGIVNFSPVPSRQIQATWVDGFNRLSASMTEKQRRRLTALYLLVAYIHGGEDFMPLVPMLSGHPNFLADVKATPAVMAFLFPDHPMASAWTDLWEKNVELNTRYNTRPAVKTWDAQGGRWTENLGTYVWAFLRPSLRTAYLMRRYDGRERFVSPQLTAMTEWLVGSLSAPFNGETEQAYRAAAGLDGGHEWGVLAPGKGPRRIHPPQGAHAERRVPPRSLWYLGTCLTRYAPLAAEHAMWAARPTDQDMETAPGAPSAWDAMYAGSLDNLGTNPHLRSAKFTGYGLVLRGGVDTPDEVSVHLQQIDQGPNYRWGRSSEGGCGVLYFFANGKAYSMHGAEDVGDRNDQDTDFCTNFGVYKNGSFHAIGMNVLSRPLYDLGAGQYAEIVPREDSSPYATPEYLSRSILLAGHQYFVVYDSLLDPSIVHRLSWFVRRGDELPNIHLVRGGGGDPRTTQRSTIETAATTGVWFDGTGDSMAVVSHRKDLDVKATPFGCVVKTEGVVDLIFRNPEPIVYVDGQSVFNGTAGLIRSTPEKIEFSLFHGTRIGIAGFVFMTEDIDLGIGGSIVNGQSPRGIYYAPKASTLKVTLPPGSAGLNFFVDGSAMQHEGDVSSMSVHLAAGQHHWELTGKEPVPLAPHITRTENIAGGARIVVAAVASASSYRLELRHDNGATWTGAGEFPSPAIELKGLSNGSKVHIRAIARNAAHESLPGSEYPIYVTNQPPPAPDGFRVSLAAGAASLTWGEILGASGYRLYFRKRGNTAFQLLSQGTERQFVDRRPGIQVCNAVPGRPVTDSVAIFEYCVAAVNGNGEGSKSNVADTDPSSWRNWDPMPGEPFRRVASFIPDSPPTTSEWARYYPE